jgi:hypothetical protein
MYSKACVGKHWSDNFLIQNDLKQGDALSPIFFNFRLEYDITEVQENQVGLKLNGTHQLLVYADNVNLLGDNIDTIQENTETLTVASKGIGLGVNAEKIKYMLLPHHQTAKQDHAIKIAYRCSENVAHFKHFETTVTNQNLIQEEIKETEFG